MEIVVTNAQIRVMDAPDGSKVLQFAEQNGIVVTIPMVQRAARELAAMLGSGIVVANGSIPEPPIKPS